MIGGYIYRRPDADLLILLDREAAKSHRKIQAWDSGYFFYDDPFKDNHTTRFVSDDAIVLSQDLLVTTSAGGEYRSLSVDKEFAGMLKKDGAAAFNAITSDFRMVVVQKIDLDKRLMLASCRAGSGRLYYRILEEGILFSSDLRFLLRCVPLAVSKVGMYAILKYGAIPEPLTISENISAVPPAHYLEYDVNSGKHRLAPYFTFRFTYGRRQRSVDAGRVSLEPVGEVLRKSASFLSSSDPVMLLSGGIDSSLYGCYLGEERREPLQAYYCVFGKDDPELPFAEAIAGRVGAQLHVVAMEKGDALTVLEDMPKLTDHPFSDYSSLPVTYLLQRIRSNTALPATVIECNGGDDCFGFIHLANRTKYTVKHYFPKALKMMVASALRGSPYWKWESHEGALSRVAALADVHEASLLDYFLVVAPVNYLGLEVARQWDRNLAAVMETVFSACGEDYPGLCYEAKTTIRQLLHVNSRMWAAKAHSLGESLGLRIVYPFIWRDVLVEQGKLPWSAKIHDGIVKWPLKRLLEAFMPDSFIYRKKSGFVPPFVTWLTDRDFNYRVRDILVGPRTFVSEIVPRRLFHELLDDALHGKRLRSPLLFFLWSAIMTEMWVQQYKSAYYSE